MTDRFMLIGIVVSLALFFVFLTIFSIVGYTLMTS